MFALIPCLSCGSSQIYQQLMLIDYYNNGFLYIRQTWSCVLRASMAKRWLITPIDPRLRLDWHLDRHPIDFSIDTQSTLNQQPDQHLSWLTLDQQLVHSGLSVNRLLCIEQDSMVCLGKLVNSQSTVNWDVDVVLIKYQWRCLYRECPSSIDWQSTTDAFSTHDAANKPRIFEKEIVLDDTFTQLREVIQASRSPARYLFDVIYSNTSSYQCN